MRGRWVRASWLRSLWIVAIVTLTGLSFENATAESPARILALSVDDQDDRGQVVISHEGILEARHFSLVNPDRLVVDFGSTHWDADLKALDDFEPVDRARVGLFRPDQFRLIMDLSAPYIVRRSYARENNGRSELVIDLERVARDNFEAIAGWPDRAKWDLPEEPSVEAAPGDLIVVIDPGHGGFDPGASGDDLVEKEIVLEVGLAIAELINKEPGFTAVLTRDDDSFVPLRGRLDIAHRYEAHAFVSLHADSITEGDADGVSIYTLSNVASDAASRDFAERENRVDILAGADLVGETDELAQLLLELSRRGTDVESDKLARSILSAFKGRIDLLQTRPYRQAGFYVLKAPDVPSVLIELGFLSSQADRDRLASDGFAESVAEAMVIGLYRWRAIADPAFISPRN